MKIYRLNSNINEEMTMDEAIDYLQIELHFTLDDVCNIEDTEKQAEMIEILLDAYFITEEIEEYCNDDYWENDQDERIREYRKIQGF